MGEITVGLDIGTTSIKAVAVAADGTVAGRVRIPHEVRVPEPECLEHDARRAWWRNPRRALSQLQATEARAIAVAGMVPSLAAVDTGGRPTTPGLLYGDRRGRGNGGEREAGGGAGQSDEAAGFLRWAAAQAPGAAGYWPAQAVANRSLGGRPAIDLAVAFTASPLFGPEGWDADLVSDCGASVARLAEVELPGAPVGRLGGSDAGPVIAAGSVDVWCEQLVAGAAQPGDVHVICGTTLIIWVVTSAADTSTAHPGLWSTPSSNPAIRTIGGASNAGGLFLDWCRRLAGRRTERVEPGNVPVWVPYPRGERTPYHDASRRAALHDLDLTHGPGALQRAAWEASGFVVRHHIDLAAVAAKRLVATGGGTRVEGWMQALSDATGLPVHVAAEPEGAARGAAFLARMAAGLESDLAEAARWAATGRVVEPDSVWSAPTADRYRRFLELSGPPEPTAGSA
jgi:xylulokinase